MKKDNPAIVMIAGLFAFAVIPGCAERATSQSRTVETITGQAMGHPVLLKTVTQTQETSEKHAEPDLPQVAAAVGTGFDLLSLLGLPGAALAGAGVAHVVNKRKGKAAP